MLRSTTHYLVILLFLLSTISYPQYRTLFTSRSTQPDYSGGKQLEENKVPRNLKLDLNKDGSPEIIETSYGNCSSNGCLWQIKDGKTQKNIGQVKGETVYVLKNKSDGFNDLETFWKLGGGKATVYFYSYSKGTYKEVKNKNLSGDQIPKYFEKKPPFTKELKELN